MDHSNEKWRFDPLVLRDSQTAALSLGVSGFNDAADFAEPRQQPFFSILVITEGKGRLARDGGDFFFEAPCLACFAIYQPFTVVAEAVSLLVDGEGLVAKGAVRGVRLDFHPSFFCLFEHRREVSCNGVLFNNLYDTPIVNLETRDLELLLTVAGQIGDELGGCEQPDKDILLSFLKIFLINAARIKLAQQQVDADKLKKAAPIVNELTNAIEANYKTLHQAGDYEKLLYTSASVLNKASKQYFRKTVTGLIADRLIIEAKRQLYLTAKPVKEIAFELGYNDEFYFSRFFKKYVGVSPQLFRDTVGFNRSIA